jgi:hypothetical protein
MPIIATRASAAYGAGFGKSAAAAVVLETGSYDAIASVTIPSGGVSSFTFAGIPLGYRNLEIYWKMATSVGNRDMLINFNDDTSAVYQNFIVYAGSGAVNSAALVGQTKIIWGGGTSTVNEFAGGTTTIFDADSSVKYKGVQAVYGYAYNGSSIGTDGTANLNHSLNSWGSLSPISKITISVSSGVINANSSFDLYGVK